MKKFYFCLTFLLFPLISTGQSKIGYTYDAAGNRIKREIVLPMSNDQKNAFSDMLGGHSVKISNPADGVLNVSVGGLKSTENCTFGVYTSQGKQIMAGTIRTADLDINISNQPAGIYMLKITINNNSATWKIVKK